jgi:hypothetical protein
MRALRELDPALVCAVLKMFPAYQDGRAHSRAATPAEQRQRVATLREALLHDNVPRELADMLYHVAVLSEAHGWDEIRVQAELDNSRLDLDVTGLSAADKAVKAWLHAWPGNSELLGRTYMRLHAASNVQSETIHVYYPPAFDLCERYRNPAASALRKLERELAAHFAADGRPGAVQVNVCDTERDLCLLVTHVDQSGPEGTRTEDVVCYHKGHGDLRVTAHRKRDHALYRAKVGQLMFGEASAFLARAKMVNMDALRGNVLSLFRCDDVAGLAEIQPVEVKFLAAGLSGIRTTWESDSHDSLLDLPLRGGRIVPEDAFMVVSARLRYRLRGRGEPVDMRLMNGSTLTYQRAGDGTVIEDWLRRRRFIRGEKGPAPR